MDYVALTKWEWQIICAQGGIRILEARVCDILKADANADANACEVSKLFEFSPQFNLGDAHALLIAELIPDWRSIVPLDDYQQSDVVRWLSLQGVKCFFPLTEAALGSFHDKATEGAILVEHPKFERYWHDWVTQQTRAVMNQSAKRFVRILGLGESLPDVLHANYQHGDLDVSISTSTDSLLMAFLDHSKKLTKNDDARSREGTCAHGIVCATLWASFRCGRTIPADDSELRVLLDRRLERYGELQYADAGYLTDELHREFNMLACVAPEAFNKFLSATSIGIYLRFSVAIQHGPAPKPKHLVEAILRLQMLDGDLVAATCAYLIGLKLKPQDVHQIAMATEGDKYSTVNMAAAVDMLGLGSLTAIRQSLSAVFCESDVASVVVEVSNEHSSVLSTDGTEHIHDGSCVFKNTNGRRLAPQQAQNEAHSVDLPAREIDNI